MTDADDIRAVDSLLDAIAAGDDVPEGPVADLLRRAAADLDVVEAPGDEVVATWIDAIHRGTSWADGRRARRLVPILVIGGSLLFGGAAAAASGSLPDPLQDAVHDVVGLVGIDVPSADEADDDVERPTPTTERDDDGDAGDERDGDEGGGVGSEGVAPGQGGTVPGTGAEGGGNGVGSDGTPPGQGGTVPGTEEETGGNGVGSDGLPPGQGGTNPGNGSTPTTPTTRTPPTRPTPSSTIPTPPSNGGQGQGQGQGNN